MDVTSYLLGKQAGGGGSEINNQDKNVTITTNGSSTVTADSGYTGLGTVGITTNVQPNLETLTETITTNGTTTYTPSTGKDGFNSVSITTNVGGGSYDMQSNLDTTSIIYAGNISNRITEISLSPNISFVQAQNLFSNMKFLETAPLIDTSGNGSFSGMFANDTNLTNMPLYDTSTAKDFSGMFNGIGNKLTNTSLDNVLQMCINATSYTGTKTLATLSLNEYRAPVARIEALPHYQDFINAGWTIGY